MAKTNGKIIVFEGIDGCGKSTQVELLLTFLKKQKIKTAYYKFPQYSKTVYGKIVGDFLTGKLGKVKEVNPYLISLPYASDRATVVEKIKREKREGKIVIIDRYVHSTTAHQESRLEGREKNKFRVWQLNLEYKINKMPSEDLVFLLEIPVKNAWELMSARKRDRLEKKYLQEKTREVYLQLAKKNKNWVTIQSFEKEELKPKEKIHEEIVQTLKDKKII